ncbi:AAA-like domain-containing protein [Microcoleus sp. PH2017_28_MFU_U_A]|uniref:WD40 domain-containing protein n=1 Tax=Microcoleus sp. PH2017_28_MFU_U_A TaxID=2798838 RepID=UPI001DC11759|nr:AAA-like domain-containing protein [Microcoleus sp. PH2017_28_MFU_U_A]MCC3593255.1 AAA-like domain-containing protein [Microcoleus sp. PH2017_28_MFU_U_A]
MTVYQYQVGGSLEYEHPTYVKRLADSELYASLIAGEFCYVLNSRQMGKSSLQVQTMKRLREKAGFKCIAIDLTDIGSETSDYWYFGIISELVRGGALSRKVDSDSWWQQRQLLSPSQRLSQFIEDVLLTEISQNIVIFIDEIDSILNLSWKDDFFLLIRACYNKRAINSEYKRLTFCLLGVATPADLIRDKDRTPFNIGKAIDLTGFTFDEAKPALIPGLMGERSQEISEEILAEVFQWTNGQPFLMQKLCQLMVYKSASRTADVEDLVKKYVIDNWEANDEQEHFKTIRRRLLLDYQDRTALLLGIYQQILTDADRKICADNSLDQRRLQLSGLVVKRNGYLQVYNPIYAAIFNLDWVQQELAKLRPYQENFAAWIASNRQDTSRLLHGQALDDALQWKVGKRLSDEDNDFLDASRDDERQELKKNNKSLRAFRKQFREVFKIEEAGRNALELFHFEGKQIEALRAAIKAGEDLKQWIPDNPPLSEYPTVTPLSALQVIIAKIRKPRVLIGHRGWVTSVSFSPKGDVIATASSDNTAKLWDLQGNCLATFTGHKKSVWSVSFSPNGDTIATASFDKKAKLWDLQGNCLVTFTGHKQSVTSISFSPTGDTIATASSDKTAKLWDLQGNCLLTFTGHYKSVWSVSFSPNGDAIATASVDKTAKLWDLQGNCLVTFTGHNDSVTSVSFSPTGDTIATASYDDTAKLWELQGNCLATFTDEYNNSSVNSLSFSSTGKTIATASHDGTAKLWNLEGKCLITFIEHRFPVNSVSFSPKGDAIATASSDDTAKLWELQDNYLATFAAHNDSVRSVNFSPTGDEMIATALDDKTAKFWDLQGNCLVTFIGHNDWVRSVSFSPNGDTIATASSDKTAKLWDLQGNCLATFTGHNDRVTSICFSPSGDAIATASQNKTAKLWDLQGNCLLTFTGHNDSVNSVSFNPEGDAIATASSDKTAKLWALQGNCLVTFTGHNDRVTSICFSPTGDAIATTSKDKTAKLWDLQGNCLVTFTGHNDSVWSVSFSPTGDTIATASQDGTAKLWDLQGNLLAEFSGYQGNLLKGEADFVELKTPIYSICFSRDGKFLITGSQDGKVRFWPVESLDELLARGREWLGDKF